MIPLKYRICVRRWIYASLSISPSGFDWVNCLSHLACNRLLAGHLWHFQNYSFGVSIPRTWHSLTHGPGFMRVLYPTLPCTVNRKCNFQSANRFLKFLEFYISTTSVCLWILTFRKLGFSFACSHPDSSPHPVRGPWLTEITQTYSRPISFASLIRLVGSKLSTCHGSSD